MQLHHLRCFDPEMFLHVRVSDLHQHQESSQSLGTSGDSHKQKSTGNALCQTNMDVLPNLLNWFKSLEQ